MRGDLIQVFRVVKGSDKVDMGSFLYWITEEDMH